MTAINETASRPLRNTAYVVTAVFACATLAGFAAPGLLPFFVWSTFISGLHAWYFRLQTADQRMAAARKNAEENTKTGSSSVWALEEETPVLRSPSLPSFQKRGQWGWLGTGVLVTGWIIFRVWHSGSAMPFRLSPQLQIAVSIGAGVVLHVLSRYARVLGESLETAGLKGIANLARFAFWVGLIFAASRGALLILQRDLLRQTDQFLAILTAILVVEGLIQAVLRLYRPSNPEEALSPLGNSFLLETVFNRINPWEEASNRMEDSLGVNLSDTWGFRFVKRSIGPVAVTAGLLTWGATAATVVPVGHTGVRIRLGTFSESLANPGLHWTYPWPFETMEIIPTGRVEEFILGFEEDTGQPILWTEQHYVGEKNLLVGDGDELLTISVPVQYRISDPLAYLMSTTESRTALEHLAYRELLRVATARDSFAMMTDERAEVSTALQQGLQAAADAQRLGVEVVWVGLRDIHPPVDVTSAYQDVVSAEEERQTLVEVARAYRANTLPAAHQEANRLRVMSEAARQSRTLTAEGEAERFQLLSSAEQEHPELFRTRVTLETKEQAWSRPVKLLFATDTPPNISLDAREKGDTSFP